MGHLWSDENKFATWLRVEVLACEAMHEMGDVPHVDLNRIRKRAAFSVARIAAIEKKVDHDVIAFLTNVAESVGPSARFIHKGLTSSDVVDTALAVQLVASADLLLAAVNKVRAAAKVQARRHRYTPMIGRTHGVHAEPLTFGLKMALMVDEFGRAEERLRRAREVVRVGQLSGAVGTHAHLDPFVEAYVCRKLKLKPAALATQVLQRDRHAEFVTALALVGASVERWAQEFRHLQRTEVREVEEFFGKNQKGSSAMPHKRNPVVGERLCGMARLLRGYALVAMENVPLWHERDISHSSAERVILPDACIALDYMLAMLADLVKNLKVNRAQMRNNLKMTHGLIHSQQVLLKLVEKGLSRETAYALVQKHAMHAWEKGTDFKSLLMADAAISRHLTRQEWDELFDVQQHFRRVDLLFKRVGIS
jgi:adenylosuccinate lyase